MAKELTTGIIGFAAGFVTGWLKEVTAKEPSKDVHLNDEFINGDWQTNWVNSQGIPEPWIINGGTDYIRLIAKPNTIKGPDTYTGMIYRDDMTGPITDMQSLLKFNIMGYGYYAVRIAVNRVPTEATVYCGIALWEYGKSWETLNFNEVNIGYFTEGGDERLKLFSAKDGVHSTIAMTNTDYNLSKFIGAMHTLEFVYQSDKIEYYFDGKFIGKKIDNIPNGVPMAFIVSVRVDKPDIKPLITDFFMICQYARIFVKVFRR